MGLDIDATFNETTGSKIGIASRKLKPKIPTKQIPIKSELAKNSQAFQNQNLPPSNYYYPTHANLDFSNKKSHLKNPNTFMEANMFYGNTDGNCYPYSQPNFLASNGNNSSMNSQDQNKYCLDDFSYYNNNMQEPILTNHSSKNINCDLPDFMPRKNCQDFDDENYWCGSNGFGSEIEISVNNESLLADDESYFNIAQDSLEKIFAVGTAKSEENHSFNFSDFLNSENSRRDSCENFGKLSRNILGSESESCSDLDLERQTEDSAKVILEDDSSDYSMNAHKLNKKIYWNFLGFPMTDFRETLPIFSTEDAEKSTTDQKFCCKEKDNSLIV